MNGQFFLRASQQFVFFAKNIGEEQKKRSSRPQMSYKRNQKAIYVLVSETSAAAFPLIRFHVLARVPQKRARVPSLARVPGVAYPWRRASLFGACFRGIKMLFWDIKMFLPKHCRFHKFFV